MLLLALAPATPSLALAMQGQGRRPFVGLLQLDIAQIQREADYMRDPTNAYFNPTYGLIALGLGAFFGLAWLFGSEPAARLRGDPVPSRVRTRLDRLDGARLAVLAGIRAAKAYRAEAALAAEQALYDRLAADADDVLDKLRRDLLLNLVDEDFLVPALDALSERARSLSFRLQRLAPVRAPSGDAAAGLAIGHGTLAAINRGWERVFSGESPKMATIRHSSAMRWPAWSRIDIPPRRPV
jgi:hypothetical protein